MLLTKALANITPATAEGINVILKLIYSEQDNAFSVDLGGMDMQYKMLYRPEDWQYGIMLAGNIVPKPAAVGAGTFTINEYFGFSEAISWQPFDIAVFGDRKWTRNMNGGVTETSPGTFEKTSGTSGFNAQVYSSEGYMNNVSLSWSFGQTDKLVAVGLNADAPTNASYNGIDFCVYEFYNGAVIYESGRIRGIIGEFTTSDVFSIDYVDGHVTYKKNDVVFRTTSRELGTPLSMDSSFSTVGAKITGLSIIYEKMFYG